MSELQDLVEELYRQFSEDDWADAERIFSPDVVTVAPGSDPLHGLETFKVYTAGFHRAAPDARIALTQVVAESGTAIACEGVFSGTNTGPLVGPMGELPATGRSFELPFCDAFDVEEGKITGHRVYFDQMAFLGQLGLIPGQ
jgi:predicted ester cyclase